MPNNPVVVSYVPTFLKLEQMHVYRQILGLRHKIDVHVFTHKRENADRFGYVEKWVHVLPKPRLRWWRRFLYKQVLDQPWQMYRWELAHWLQHLARADARLLHIYFGHVGPQFIPLLKVWRHPTVLSFHGADVAVDMEKPKYRAAMQEVFRLVTKVQCRSEALGRDLEALGCPPEKIVLHRTGIVTEQWPLLERPSPADRAWRFVQSGRYVDKKGLDLTLRAFAMIVAKYPQARLTLVGDGPLRSALEQQAKVLGIAEHVLFTGFRKQSEVKAFIEQSHVYLQPSRTSENGDREGVPNALLEAMCSGLPVVASRHGGIPEAVEHERSGLLIEENDAEGLAAAALRIMEEPGLADKLSAGGHAMVAERFSRTAQDERLAVFYRDLIAAHDQR